MQPNASDVQRQKINVNPVNYISVEKKNQLLVRGGGGGGTVPTVCPGHMHDPR